jgi:hypothetical protein
MSVAKPKPQVTVAMDALLAALTFMGITEKSDTDLVLKTVLKIVERNSKVRS